MGTKPEFLRQLRHALMEVGFLYLENVGEVEELFEQVITRGKAFFDIPTEEKQVLNAPFLPSRIDIQKMPARPRLQLRKTHNSNH